MVRVGQTITNNELVLVLSFMVVYVCGGGGQVLCNKISMLIVINCIKGKKNNEFQLCVHEILGQVITELITVVGWGNSVTLLKLDLERTNTA